MAYNLKLQGHFWKIYVYNKGSSNSEENTKLGGVFLNRD